MAVNNSPLLLDTDQFLLNRDGGTFKIPFDAIAGNVLDFIIDPDQNGDKESLIFLTNLGDVDTDLYIKTRNADGTPASIGSRAADSVDFDSAFWLLQAVNGKVSDERDGGSAKEQFVLADAGDVFAEITGDIGEALRNLELNDLLDVRTKLTDTTYIPTTTGDGILLHVSNGPGGRPEYAPRSLSSTVTDIIKDPQGGIEINVGDLGDVNPIFNVGPLGGLVALPIRLLVTDDFNNGIVDAVKYVFEFSGKEDDDILVYITSDSDIIDYIASGGLPPAAVDKDGNAVNSLPPGWYYAENVGGVSSNSFREEQLAQATESYESSAIAVGDDVSGSPATLEQATDIESGVVRVLNKYSSTGAKVLEYNAATNKYVLGAKYRTDTDRNTNIGITDEGILYSEIPNTLSFVQVIDIVGSEVAAIDETLLKGNLVTFGLDVVTGAPISLVPAEGPGDSQTPDSWNASSSVPDVGDFYVVRFIDDPTKSELDPTFQKGSFKVLDWNKNYPLGNPTPESDLKVENGDIVVFGPEGWNIMGSVQTETIAQDLQSVTERGYSTDRPIKLLGEAGDNAFNGLIAGKPKNIASGSQVTVLANSGVVAADVIFTNKIDFDAIEELPAAPAGFPLP